MNIKNRRLWQIVAGTVLTLIVVTVVAQRSAVPAPTGTRDESRGFSFVRMDDQDAREATETLNRNEVDSHTTKVNEANPLDTSQFQPLFVLERKNNHLGDGASISPDGGMLVYIGSDNGLYLRDLETEQERLLLKEAGPGLDVFLKPVFSPDGTKVFFSASGGTYYYPSDVYSIKIDGSGLQRLTRAKGFLPGQEPASGNAMYAEYFYSAQPAPDSTKILLHLYDAVRGSHNTALIDSDGLHLEIIDQGTPLFWSNNGQVVYYSQANVVKRFDLSTRGHQTIAGLKGKILGKWPDRDDREMFGVESDGDVSLMAVRDASSAAMTKWNIPTAKFAAPQDQRTGVRNIDQLALTSFQWSKSGRVLLVYKGEAMERLEVLGL